MVSWLQIACSEDLGKRSMPIQCNAIIFYFAIKQEWDSKSKQNNKDSNSEKQCTTIRIPEIVLFPLSYLQVEASLFQENTISQRLHAFVLLIKD